MSLQNPRFAHFSIDPLVESYFAEINFSKMCLQPRSQTSGCSRQLKIYYPQMSMLGNTQIKTKMTSGKYVASRG